MNSREHFAPGIILTKGRTTMILRRLTAPVLAAAVLCFACCVYAEADGPAKVTGNIEGGWDVEIVSPLSCGARMIRAAAYYDCSDDAFVYPAGMKYDLLPEGDFRMQDPESGHRGELTFEEAEENLQAAWYGNTDGGTVAFERAPAV